MQLFCCLILSCGVTNVVSAGAKITSPLFTRLPAERERDSCARAPFAKCIVVWHFSVSIAEGHKASVVGHNSSQIIYDRENDLKVMNYGIDVVVISGT